MSKNRIKSLRDITVDDQDYKWSFVDGFKIWKDKKLVYEGDWYNEKKYPQVTYAYEGGGMTPGIVAKVIRQLNGTEKVVSIKNLSDKFNEIGFGIGIYNRNTTFEDSKAEKLWVKFNDVYKELEGYLNEKT